jgi:hypothetical protein
MATQDISRSAFDPRKQYASVRMQQGRVILDDDWNENERIANEELRRSRVEIVGPAGSPDRGFQITNPRITPKGRIDFDINAGSFYLGGLRLELHEPQTYLLQRDSLQKPGQGDTAPTKERFDLVALLTYQQPVSAVEDRELFEVALGGPDTSTRLRTMQRVLLWEDVGADNCEAAWQVVLEKLLDQGFGTLNAEHEFAPEAKLTVTFAPAGTPDDLCTPTAAGGYLGAENQAIRVQLIDKQHLTWSFDNTAQFYRVRLAGGDRQTLEMLTEPKDQAHWPLAEQVVEILPWAAVLPNNEKIAEVQGHLSRVIDSYNPDTGQLKLADPIPADGFDDWVDRTDAGELNQGGEYYYLRVWNRGADHTSPPAIPFNPGVAVPLGHTGLEITLEGSQFLAGDYWIIAARPETPNRVVPWELEAGRRPHGIRRFLTPLALIHWPGGPGGEPEVDDCRPRFRPLTEQEICCTYTVGDGRTSHGDFDSIEAAVQHLPAAGGKICLLPGLHEANVVIRNRSNITISGCAEKTQVIPREGKRQEPLFHVVDSQGIILEEMDLVTVEGSAVVALGSEPGLLREITVRRNRMLVYQNGVHLKQGEQIKIEGNIIRMLDKVGGDVALYILADGAWIERNDIGVVPPEVVPPTGDPDSGGEDVLDPADPCADPESFYLNPVYFLAFIVYVWLYRLISLFPTNPYKTLGGIQIGSGSERIKIVDNEISGGAGNGITLGSDLEATDLPPDAAQTFRLEPRAKQAWVGVMDGQNYLSDVAVTLSSETETITAVTDSDGYFTAPAEANVYTVSVDDLDYRIKGISTTDKGELGVYHEITVVSVDAEIDLVDVLAFIYEVTIEGNEIANMGLSGIGIPQIGLKEMKTMLSGDISLEDVGLARLALPLLTLKLFGALVGFVVDLRIQGNQIFRCLGNAFLYESLDLGARARGVGGISLGFCESLVIRDNRIEANGPNYHGPVHGIFVIYGNQIDISRNHILDNGPSIPSDLQQGQTGGIALASVTVSDFFLIVDGQEADVTRAERQAARVHDNVVHQPVGRALTISLGLGPISVVNNQFSTDFAVAKSGTATVTAGSQAVMGGNLSYADAGTTLGGGGILRTLFKLGMNTGAVFILNLGMTALLQQFLFDEKVAKESKIAQALLNKVRLPVGSTMFNDNQVRLGAAQQSIVSQAIFSLDDVSYDSNQADVLTEQALGANAMIVAATVRAGHNRLQEPVSESEADWFKQCSMFTYGLGMNSTSLNQGNHCILALGKWRLFDQGNLAMVGTTGECRKMQPTLDEIMSGLQARLYTYGNLAVAQG